MIDSREADDPVPTTERRAWLRSGLAAPGPIAAGFAAGAALARLDVRVHSSPGFAGAFRSRMALICAARVGLRRLSDEAALRDCLYFAAEDADPGPEGRALQAWRLLYGAKDSLRAAATLFGVAETDEFEARIDEAGRALALSPGDPPPVHAAKIAFRLARGWPEAEPLALYAADLALGRAMGWRKPVPLLAAGLPRRGAALISTDRPEAETIASVCLAYARAAETACDIFAELDRAAAKLAAVAPKLRSKQADFVLRRLCDDDAAPGSMRIPGLTKRSARRLFDRLVSLGAVRELTGRETFRLYGL